MLHKVKVTVIDKKCYVDLQEQYCHDPQSGPCPCYQVGDEFIFERYGGKDDYWHGGLNTLVKTLYLCRTSRWLNYERLDERGKHNDYLL